MATTSKSIGTVLFLFAILLFASACSTTSPSKTPIAKIVSPADGSDELPGFPISFISKATAYNGTALKSSYIQWFAAKIPDGCTGGTCGPKIGTGESITASLGVGDYNIQLYVIDPPMTSDIKIVSILIHVTYVILAPTLPSGPIPLPSATATSATPTATPFVPPPHLTATATLPYLTATSPSEHCSNANWTNPIVLQNTGGSSLSWSGSVPNGYTLTPKNGSLASGDAMSVVIGPQFQNPYNKSTFPVDLTSNGGNLNLNLPCI